MYLVRPSEGKHFIEFIGKCRAVFLHSKINLRPHMCTQRTVPVYEGFKSALELMILQYKVYYLASSVSTTVRVAGNNFPENQSHI